MIAQAAMESQRLGLIIRTVERETQHMPETAKNFGQLSNTFYTQN